jgi:hypothetical protein
MFGCQHVEHAEIDTQMSYPTRFGPNIRYLGQGCRLTL